VRAGGEGHGDAVVMVVVTVLGMLHHTGVQAELERKTKNVTRK
jgi:hypothetical protein